jgi:hypothetical protein
MLYYSTYVLAGLNRSTWSGKTKLLMWRKGEMMAYLSELIDDLLMDPRNNTDSEAPGFEAPLGYYVRLRKT